MRKRRVVVPFVAVVALLVLSITATTLWVLPQISWASPESPAITQATVDPITAAQLDVAGVLPSQEVLSNLYDTVANSVVNIQVTSMSSGAAIPGFPFGSPSEPAPAQGQGSGFIYDAEGHIVTNNHVVEDATSIVVYFSNGMWADATLVARDPQADLAVIKVDPPTGMAWEPLPLAADDSLRVGYYVAALGSPFGLNETMTVGIVSALGRSFPTGDPAEGTNYSLPDVIQTDTAINPGNSGGPLLNLKGEVVGVNFAINSPVRANSGVGFAIPISVVHRVVPALIEDGAYRYSYLGIAGSTINDSVAEENNLPDNRLGVFVGTVVENGPAMEAGIEAGDVIIRIDEMAVSRFEDLIAYLMQETEPGQSVDITVLRDGSQQVLSVTLMERPSGQRAESATVEGTRIPLAEAIRIARRAIADAELMTQIDSATAEAGTHSGQPVWIVTLTGNDKTAEVIVDGMTGEVVALNIQ